MKTRLPTRIQHLPRRQRGVALFVALVFLVILTVIGVTALGNNSLQTRMAYGGLETNRAFQAADSALIAGETWLTRQIDRPIASCTSPCTDPVGVWPRTIVATPVITATELASEAWWASNGHRFDYSSVEGAVPGPVAAQSFTTNPTLQPVYVVEEDGFDGTNGLGQGRGPVYKIYYFQVSARGLGAQNSSRTVVQSVYARGY